jgi:hypothetical protein
LQYNTEELSFNLILEGGSNSLNLFNRAITVSVQSKDDEHLVVNGLFIDSNHELVLRMTVNIESLIVTEAFGEFRRAPHKDCLVTCKAIQNLQGTDLNRSIRRQVVSAVGGEGGCVHLEELSLECIKGIKQAKFSLMRLRMPQEEVHSQIYDLLEGSCHHFRTR